MWSTTQSSAKSNKYLKSDVYGSFHAILSQNFHKKKLSQFMAISLSFFLS